jgi:FkbM family methyltransferase
MIASAIFRTGFWEPEITRLLAVATRPGTTVLDVGANIGASAIPLLAAFPDIRVLSFEPSPSVLPYLLRTRGESRFHNRWEVVQKAVTASVCEEVTFVRFANAGSDVYEGVRDTGRGGQGCEIRVPTTTIDAEWMARGRPPVSLIKIDVEGAELGVLTGAEECLRGCQPVIVTEWCAKNFTAYGAASGAMLDVAMAAGYEVHVLPELSRVTDYRLFDYLLSTRENLLLLPNQQSPYDGAPSCSA